MTHNMVVVVFLLFFGAMLFAVWVSGRREKIILIRFQFHDSYMFCSQHSNYSFLGTKRKLFYHIIILKLKMIVVITMMIVMKKEKLL